MKQPIYKPKGAAAEYGDYAVNIYTGCPHRCYYCFAPQVLRRTREAFHSCVEPRKDIVQKVRQQLEREQITGQLIHLCFTCDPYPTGYDTTATREVIQALKEYGNHVQILTKGDGRRDFDLLDGEDWYGVTIDGGSTPIELIHTRKMPAFRLGDIHVAHNMGIKTWVSFEPVLWPEQVIGAIRAHNEYIDKAKIGKLNYRPSNTNWAQFGRDVEAVCREVGLDYYIKDSLRAEMDKP